MEVHSLFYLNQIVLLSLLFGIFYATGRLVSHSGVRVNYTRKINHFAIFFLPIILGPVFVYDKTPVTRTLGLVFAICTLIIFFQPLRSAAELYGLCFSPLTGLKIAPTPCAG